MKFIRIGHNIVCILLSLKITGTVNGTSKREMIYRKEERKKKKYIEVRFYVFQKYEPSKIKLEFSLKWST